MYRLYLGMFRNRFIHSRAVKNVAQPLLVCSCDATSPNLTALLLCPATARFHTAPPPPQVLTTCRRYCSGLLLPAFGCSVPSCIATKQMKMKTKMKMEMLHLLIGCLALSTLSHGQQDQNPGFLSIDSGAPNSYYDNRLNLTYNNDVGFVDSGTNMQVSVEDTSLHDKRSNDMRVFPNGTRNCYTLKPNQGKGHKYLIRVSFFYGDYDGNNQTPIFDLHIDVNYWETVHSSSYEYKEIIYTPLRDFIQVCLVNIGLGVPFVSAIELRPLNDSIYPMSSSALVTYKRENLGDTDTYRHPDDEYDRIWWGVGGINSYLSVRNTCVCTKDIVTSTNNDDYKVPPQVLMTAGQTQDVNDSLNLFWTTSYNSTTTWYVYFHFVELTPQVRQFRELETYVGNKFVKSVTLNNSKPVTVVSLPFGGSEPNLTVKATTHSSLPPLLNAVEVFYVRKLPLSPTILDDLNAMYDIKRRYEVARVSWQGDPCVPTQYSWSGVNCTYDGSPRIVSLDLSSTGLKGLIAASLSNLTALVSLNLSNNQLIGWVPDFFAQMPSLKILNLSQNNLNGSVPQALLKKKADGSLQLSLEGNPNLCQSNTCPTNRTIRQAKKERTNIAAIIAGISVIIVLLTALAVLGRIKRRLEAVISGPSNESLKAKSRTFTSAEVARITDNFRTVIGEGAFGKVFLGRLDEGDQSTQVAVKLLSPSSGQGYKEFQTEVQLLMVIHHRNLVSLIGYCKESETMALIYEFMSNGNVRQHLSESNPNVLSWMQRLQIAIDAAQGLAYLHIGCKPPIIHRDMKTPNILLNENMRAKIADFGLSKAFATDLDSHIITRIAGTPGYLDPEFHKSGILSKRSDVYSFGIVLFELITGHPAFVRSQEDRIHILDWVTPLIERWDIQSIIDPRLQGQFNTGSAWKAVETAMSCVRTIAAQRPDMDHVHSELKGCLTLEIGSENSQIIGNSNMRSGSFEMSMSDLPR